MPRLPLAPRGVSALEYAVLVMVVVVGGVVFMTQYGNMVGCEAKSAAREVDSNVRETAQTELWD